MHSRTYTMATHRLSPPSILLHWLVFLLFLTALGCIEYREFLASGDPLRRTLRATHVLVGQMIFVAAIVRLVVRLLTSSATAPQTLPRWMAWGAQSVHVLLYAVMFAQPVIGVLAMQAGDKEVVFFGWVLPPLIDANPVLHFDLKDAHKLIANAFYVLVVMHMGGALMHHFVLRDDTLRHMMRWRARP